MGKKVQIGIPDFLPVQADSGYYVFFLPLYILFDRRMGTCGKLLLIKTNVSVMRNV